MEIKTTPLVASLCGETWDAPLFEDFQKVRTARLSADYRGAIGA